MYFGSTQDMSKYFSKLQNFRKDLRVKLHNKNNELVFQFYQQKQRVTKL